LRTASRVKIGAIAITVLLAIALDLRRAPAEQWTTAAAVGSIHLYQATLSPVYAKLGVQCKFTVTCSHYGEEAIKKYGLLKGGYLASKRVLRCGPWTAKGSVDPVP
jgi:putative membrane protein insertion efficiency factor